MHVQHQPAAMADEVATWQRRDRKFPGLESDIRLLPAKNYPAVLQPFASEMAMVGVAFTLPAVNTQSGDNAAKPIKDIP